MRTSTASGRHGAIHGGAMNGKRTPVVQTRDTQMGTVHAET